jgi:hypothetical protein
MGVSYSKEVLLVGRYEYIFARKYSLLSAIKGYVLGTINGLA